MVIRRQRSTTFGARLNDVDLVGQRSSGAAVSVQTLLMGIRGKVVEEPHVAEACCPSRHEPSGHRRVAPCPRWFVFQSPLAGHDTSRPSNSTGNTVAGRRAVCDVRLSGVNSRAPSEAACSRSAQFLPASCVVACHPSARLESYCPPTSVRRSSSGNSWRYFDVLACLSRTRAGSRTYARQVLAGRAARLRERDLSDEVLAPKHLVHQRTARDAHSHRRSGRRCCRSR